MFKATLTKIYDVRSIRELLVKVIPRKDFKKPTSSLITMTLGLPDEERLKLIVKAQTMGWGTTATFNVKAALKDMAPEVRTLILKEDTRLPHNVIMAIGEIKDVETQKTAIDYIQTHKLNEELSLKLIERAKTGEPLVTEVKEVDEAEAALSPYRRIPELLTDLGVNQYMILSKANRLNELLELLERARDKIEEKIKELREGRYAESG